MTAHQQTVVNQLRREFEIVEVQNDRAGTSSVIVECYHQTSRSTPIGDIDYARLANTYRVAPSGFKQDVSSEVAA